MQKFCISSEHTSIQIAPHWTYCNDCNAIKTVRGFALVERLNVPNASQIDVFKVEKEGQFRVLKISQQPEALLRESMILRLLGGKGSSRSSIRDFFKISSESITEYCLMMDWVEGENLEQWAERHAPIPEKQALNFLVQIAEILERLHEGHFFHQDIKPANIIISPDNTLTLIDFSAARQVTDTYLARVAVGKDGGEVFGSAFYIPNEQLAGKSVPQSDFFALGRTLIRLLVAVPLEKIPQENGKLLWRKYGTVSPPFANLIDALQAENPEDRPLTAKHILMAARRLPHKIQLYRWLQRPAIQALLGTTACLGVVGIVQLINSASANHFKNLGNQRYQEGNTPDAIQAYQKALTFAPDQPELLNNLAVLCQEADDYECAIAQSRRLADLGEMIPYNVGAIADDLGHFDEARSWYVKEIAIEGTQTIEAYTALSRLANLAGNFSGGERLAQEGLNRLSQSPIQDATYVKATLLKNLSWAAAGTKQWNRAEGLAKQAIALDPQSQSAHCLLVKTEIEQSQVLSSISVKNCLKSRQDSEKRPEITVWQDEIMDRLIPGK